VLRSIAAAFGVSYEQLSRDWSQINYSSARTLLNEVWRGFMADRHLFTQAFCAPIYSAWLEEAILRGAITVPGGAGNFYRNRAAFTACDWIGPGRGTIDPKKEQEAADLAIGGNRSNLAIEASEQGFDYREVMIQRSRERKLAEKLGLNPDPTPPTGPGRPAGEETGDDRPADTKRREDA
jgi:lambda family phage portal protein